MGINILSAGAILEKDLPPQQYLLKPLLFPGCLSMLFATPGLGKSYFALWMAGAIAGGGNFLRWKAEKASRVLYLDGEMGLRTLQERLLKLGASTGLEIPSENIVIATNDSQPDLCLPPISSEHAQYEYLKLIQDEKINVVIIDNYGCMVQAEGRDTDASVWGRVRPFLLKLRAMRRAVVLIHHAGKSGAQLGTSEKEQIMNWIIRFNSYQSLHYDPSETVFRLSFYKPMREEPHHENDDLIISFRSENDTISWASKDAREELKERVQYLHKGKLPPYLIQKALGITELEYVMFTRELSRDEQDRVHWGDYGEDTEDSSF